MQLPSDDSGFMKKVHQQEKEIALKRKNRYEKPQTPIRQQMVRDRRA